MHNNRQQALVQVAGHSAPARCPGVVIFFRIRVGISAGKVGWYVLLLVLSHTSLQPLYHVWQGWGQVHMFCGILYRTNIVQIISRIKRKSTFTIELYSRDQCLCYLHNYLIIKCQSSIEKSDRQTLSLLPVFLLLLTQVEDWMECYTESESSCQHGM